MAENLNRQKLTRELKRLYVSLESTTEKLKLVNERIENVKSELRATGGVGRLKWTGNYRKVLDYIEANPGCQSKEVDANVYQHSRTYIKHLMDAGLLEKVAGYGSGYRIVKEI